MSPKVEHASVSQCNISVSLLDYYSELASCLRHMLMTGLTACTC